MRKSALTEVLLFCANATDNFLERELGMKRGVPWFQNSEKFSDYGVNFLLSFCSCTIHSSIYTNIQRNRLVFRNGVPL